jgi:DNA-binding transcriptional ArsR family regulator
MDRMNDEVLDHVAYRFKLLGEPMRLRLLNCLKDGEKCVQELVDETGAGQANVSKHLSLLMNDGVVNRRKEGLHVYYFIQDESIYRLCNIVCDSLEENSQSLQEAFKQQS